MTNMLKRFWPVIILALLIAGNANAYNIVKNNAIYVPNPAKLGVLSLGSMYVGNPDTDPTVEGNQKTIYVKDESGTVTAVSQPLTIGAGGLPLYNGDPVTVLTEGDYSLMILNSLGSQVYYIPSDLDSTLDTAYVTDIATLRLSTGVAGQSVQPQGYYAYGDGAGGPIRHWSATSTATDNGGSVIRPTAIGVGDPGRWIWDYTGPIYAVWFGVKCDGATDDTAAAVAARGVAISTNEYLVFPGGTCLLEGVDTYGALYSGSNTLKIRGAGQWNTTLTNTNATGILCRLNGSFCEISDIGIDNGISTGTGLKVNGQLSKIKNVRVVNGLGWQVEQDGNTLGTTSGLYLQNATQGMAIGETNPTAYLTLDDVTIEPLSGTALKIRQGTNIKFGKLYFEPVGDAGDITKFLDLSGGNQIDFYSTGAELGGTHNLTDPAYFDIAASQSVNFDGFRVYHTGTESKTLFRLTGTYSHGVSYRNMSIQSTKAGMVLFDNAASGSCYNLTWDNISTNITNATGAVGIQDTTVNYYLSVNNWFDRTYPTSFVLSSLYTKYSNVQGAIDITNRSGQILENCIGAITGTGANTCTRIPEASETITTSTAASLRGHTVVNGNAGAIAVTIADGVMPGAFKTFYCSGVTGGSVTLTVSTHATSSPEVFVFDTNGDSLTLQWTQNKWVTINNAGVSVP
jgi:hypothetical protein